MLPQAQRCNQRGIKAITAGRGNGEKRGVLAARWLARG
jgi:hypothetical protein